VDPNRAVLLGQRLCVLVVLGVACDQPEPATTIDETDDTTGASAAPPVALLEPGKRLKNCTWSSFTDTAKVMMVTCPANTHVVSGGCLSQTRMVASAPWEDNTVGDLPEDGEKYQSVSDQNGWLCIYEDPYPSGQMATALCCE
jgi:hypothetical protein